MLGPFEGGWLQSVGIGTPIPTTIDDTDRVSVIIIYLSIISKMCHDN